MIIKIFLISAIAFSIGAIISAVIPDSLAGSINTAIVSFLTSIWYLDNFINVDIAFDCMTIILNALIGLILFGIIITFIRMLTTESA